MHLTFSTAVGQPANHVFDQFNRKLLTRLSPPFPPARIVQYEGNHTGNQVTIRLNFLVFKQDWVSRIVADGTLPEGGAYFVDEGIKLPFFLSYWHHRHTVKAQGAGALIIDAITYQGRGWLLTYLLYPVLWLQFAYRKPIYRKAFGRG